MKTTLKEFLAEQAAKGIEVPKIFENGHYDIDGAHEDEDEDEDDNDAENESFERITEKLSDKDRQKLLKLITNEGFFDKIKNAFTGTVEYNTTQNYVGSAEAQAFVNKDKRAKVQIDTLTKKGMTPEEAKAAVMYVFDKAGKNPLGFVSKSVVYDTQTKTLKVSNAGNLGGGIGQ